MLAGKKVIQPKTRGLYEHIYNSYFGKQVNILAQGPFQGLQRYFVRSLSQRNTTTTTTRVALIQEENGEGKRRQRKEHITLPNPKTIY